MMEIEEFIQETIAAERTMFKDMLIDLIPFGEYDDNEPVITRRDINKLLGRLE